MPTLEEYRENVARGAKLLDAKKPGWAALIDLDTLNVHGYATCVLAQVYETNAGIAENEAEFYNVGFTVGMNTLFGPGREWRQTFMFGFDRYSRDMIDLNPFWVEEINARR